MGKPENMANNKYGTIIIIIFIRGFGLLNLLSGASFPPSSRWDVCFFIGQYRNFHFPRVQFVLTDKFRPTLRCAVKRPSSINNMM